MKRIKIIDWFWQLAKDTAKRSGCIRRQVGAVIINKDGEPIAFGYNGAPKGETNCSDLGSCYRLEHNIPHGTQYETCRGAHAEVNALLKTTKDTHRDGVMYIYGQDFICPICLTYLKNSALCCAYITLDGKEIKKYSFSEIRAL